MHNQSGSQQPPQQDWAQYTDMPVGDVLRRTREYYGLTLADVESALRIRASQLGALEEGQPEKLPGRVYAIGFVRAYAEFLGLDGDKMVHLFKAQLGGNKPRPELNFPVPASESKLPNIFILLASSAGLAVVVMLFFIFTDPVPRSAIPEVPATMKSQAAKFGPPMPENPVTIEPAVGVAAPAEPDHRVVINVTDSAWVEIRNEEGKAILSRVLKKGDSYLVPNEPGLVMDTGNIGALEFVVDGQTLAKLGEPGDVRRGVALAPESLRPAPQNDPARPGEAADLSNSSGLNSPDMAE